ncbi:formylglycine-generating enzyme family protein [Aliishimia ponticola]|uniref:Formylglycine-generating enzyme family protein n=1 Tax=Aliishimia ponticola TaxID=2499833 RepID=A0A4V3XK21_9RHOB|nr:formylglycine-generating enzyme family protein [Aliishimia ponticola]THH35283.1 formylglycine-generating enzyme family protein [Aliishimia ponticola]
MSQTCCGPNREDSAPDPAPDTAPVQDAPCRLSFDKVPIPGGKALVGTATPGIPDDGESPPRHVRVKPFEIGRTSVTRAEFQAFVTATGYVTEAERFGWSFVFHTDVPDGTGPTLGIDGLEWWRRVDGADWRCPNGPGTNAPDDHPVTQVSWADARAFATWAGGRLPTEAEWEHAARGGLGDVPYPWGDAPPNDTDHFPCNIWQGQFPTRNTDADGWHNTAPARSFAPNGYGLYNMVGNVWEWTSEPYRVKSLKAHVKQRLAGMKGYKLSKGGSFLCHRSYCFRYRIAARSGNSPDSAAPHHGFRVVWDAR